MRSVWVLLTLVLMFGRGASAQTVATQGELERRIRVLEEQLIAIQADIVALRALIAPQESAPPIAAGSPSGLAGPPIGGDHPTTVQPAATSGPTASRVFNPDIGIIGNLISASGESRGGSDAVAPTPFLTLQESEASFQAIVDPYARADFFLAIGEEGIEVEEGFVTFPTLPGGFLVKAGKMRANFGRLNAFHNHTLPWTDRPLVMFNLLGGATGDPDTGIKDAGLSVSRLVPAGKLFMEATGEIFRGDSGTLFQSRRRQDFSLVGRLRAYGDLAESSNIEVGGSYARGHNEAGSDFLTQLYGLDLTFRWKPLRRALYRSFVARSELMWSRRDDPTLGGHDAFGMYGSADYQLGRRWFAGGRLDWSERAREVSIRDRGVSAVLTFWPSEFNQLRGQFRRTRFGDDGRVANELMLQLLFTIGAHGAHAF